MSKSRTAFAWVIAPLAALVPIVALAALVSGSNDRSGIADIVGSNDRLWVLARDGSLAELQSDGRESVLATGVSAIDVSPRRVWLAQTSDSADEIKIASYRDGHLETAGAFPTDAWESGALALFAADDNPVVLTERSILSRDHTGNPSRVELSEGISPSSSARYAVTRDGGEIYVADTGGEAGATLTRISVASGMVSDQTGLILAGDKSCANRDHETCQRVLSVTPDRTRRDCVFVGLSATTDTLGGMQVDRVCRNSHEPIGAVWLACIFGTPTPEGSMNHRLNADVAMFAGDRLAFVVGDALQVLDLDKPDDKSDRQNKPPVPSLPWDSREVTFEPSGLYLVARADAGLTLVKYAAPGKIAGKIRLARTY